MKEQRHLRIHGKVQGVGYRFYATRVARRMGLKGWIQNNRDGSVEELESIDVPGIGRGVPYSPRNPLLTGGVILLPAGAAEYSVALRLYFLVPAIVSMLCLPLWPAYGEALSRGDIAGRLDDVPRAGER